MDEAAQGPQPDAGPACGRRPRPHGGRVSVCVSPVRRCRPRSSPGRGGCRRPGSGPADATGRQFGDGGGDLGRVVHAVTGAEPPGPATVRRADQGRAAKAPHLRAQEPVPDPPEGRPPAPVLGEIRGQHLLQTDGIYVGQANRSSHGIRPAQERNQATGFLLAHQVRPQTLNVMWEFVRDPHACGAGRQEPAGRQSIRQGKRHGRTVDGGGDRAAIRRTPAGLRPAPGACGPDVGGADFKSADFDAERRAAAAPGYQAMRPVRPSDGAPRTPVVDAARVPASPRRRAPRRPAPRGGQVAGAETQDDAAGVEGRDDADRAQGRPASRAVREAPGPRGRPARGRYPAVTRNERDPARRCRAGSRFRTVPPPRRSAGSTGRGRWGRP